MKPARPTTKCMRDSCRRPYAEHKDGECPNGGGRWLYHRRASASFSHDEVDVLDELLRVILRGGDARAMARQPAFRGLASKVHTMKAAIARGAA